MQLSAARPISLPQYRPWMLGVAAVPVVLQMGLVAWISRSMLGRDFGLYMSATERWLAGGSFYLPAQLAGPYDMPWGQILYPPHALALFVPFTVLPSLLFVIVPLAITVAVIWSWRPAHWFYVALVAYLWFFPYTVLPYLAGNPTIWIVAIIALATRWPWVSAFVLLKPSVFPFALAGVRDRRWWVVSVTLAVSTLAMLPLMGDWIAAVTNARGANSGLLYSLNPESVSLLLIPVVAWLSRSSLPPSAGRHLPHLRRSAGRASRPPPPVALP